MVTDEGAWICATPLLPLDPPCNGTGDAITALFYGHYLMTKDAAQALSLATSALYIVLEKTHQAGSREIQLIATGDEFKQPSKIFGAKRVDGE